MGNLLKVKTADNKSFMINLVGGCGTPSLLTINPDGVWSGSDTLVKGERNRRVVSNAGDTCSFELIDDDNADRFNFVGLLDDRISGKRLMLFRDMVEKELILVPDLYLDGTIIDSLFGLQEAEYYVLSKFRDSSVTSSVKITSVDVTDFASNVAFSDLDIYTSTTGLTGRRNVQIFLLGSTTDLVGDGFTLESSVLNHFSIQTYKVTDKRFRTSENLSLILTF